MSYELKTFGRNLDEKIWKEYLKFIENKCAKITGFLYKAKYHLNKKYSQALCYSYLHTCINYTHITWCSRCFTNLKKLHCKQKHAVCIVHKKNNLNIQGTFVDWIKKLVAYQLNMLNNVSFMHKISAIISLLLILMPLIFQNLIARYLPTNLWKLNLEYQ